MKALVLWAEPQSANLGVRALAEGTKRLLEKTFEGVSVEFQGFGAGDAPVRIGSIRPQVRRLLSRKNELVDWVRTFDIVVDTRAGDSFTDIYGLRRLMIMALMQEVVVRAGVPLVFGPQTIGPFVTRRGALVAKRSLGQATTVMARDAASAAEADRIGRPVDVLTTDVVFALDPVSTPDRRDVIINPSGLLWTANSHVDAGIYRKVMGDLCRALRADGRQIHLLAHVIDSPLLDNDVPVAKQLARELGEDIEVLVPRDLSEVREMLASAQVVIASRMHACLNGLSLGVPAVPLAYSRKFEPLLRNIGWDTTVDLRTPVDHVALVLAALADPDLARRARAVRARADEMLAGAQRALAYTQTSMSRGRRG